MKIISRKEALKKGLRHYYTGKPCVRNHVSKRLVSDWSCLECYKVPELVAAKKQYDRENYEINGKLIRQRVTAERTLNRAKHRARNSKWKKDNPGKVAATNNKRRAKKLNATPVWFEKEEIEKMYEGAYYLRGITMTRWDVDHIVPLIGKSYVWEDGTKTPEVCGLHVYANLQYLPQKENNLKSNTLSKGGV